MTGRCKSVFTAMVQMSGRGLLDGRHPQARPPTAKRRIPDRWRAAVRIAGQGQAFRAIAPSIGTAPESVFEIVPYFRMLRCKRSSR